MSPKKLDATREDMKTSLVGRVSRLKPKILEQLPKLSRSRIITIGRILRADKDEEVSYAIEGNTDRGAKRGSIKVTDRLDALREYVKAEWASMVGMKTTRSESNINRFVCLYIASVPKFRAMAKKLDKKTPLNKSLNEISVTSKTFLNDDELVNRTTEQLKSQLNPRLAPAPPQPKASLSVETVEPQEKPQAKAKLSLVIEHVLTARKTSTLTKYKKKKYGKISSKKLTKCVKENIEKLKKLESKIHNERIQALGLDQLTQDIIAVTHVNASSVHYAQMFEEAFLMKTYDQYNAKLDEKRIYSASQIEYKPMLCIMLPRESLIDRVKEFVKKYPNTNSADTPEDFRRLFIDYRPVTAEDELKFDDEHKKFLLTYRNTIRAGKKFVNRYQIVDGSLENSPVRQHTVFESIVPELKLEELTKISLNTLFMKKFYAQKCFYLKNWLLTGAERMHQFDSKNYKPSDDFEEKARERFDVMSKKFGISIDRIVKDMHNIMTIILSNNPIYRTPNVKQSKIEIEDLQPTMDSIIQFSAFSRQVRIGWDVASAEFTGLDLRSEPLAGADIKIDQLILNKTARQELSRSIPSSVSIVNNLITEQLSVGMNKEPLILRISNMDESFLNLFNMLGKNRNYRIEVSINFQRSPAGEPEGGVPGTSLAPGAQATSLAPGAQATSLAPGAQATSLALANNVITIGTGEKQHQVVVMDESLEEMFITPGMNPIEFKELVLQRLQSGLLTPFSEEWVSGKSSSGLLYELVRKNIEQSAKKTGESKDVIDKIMYEVFPQEMVEYEINNRDENYRNKQKKVIQSLARVATDARSYQYVLYILRTILRQNLLFKIRFVHRDNGGCNHKKASDLQMQRGSYTYLLHNPTSEHNNCFFACIRKLITTSKPCTVILRKKYGVSGDLPITIEKACEIISGEKLPVAIEYEIFEDDGNVRMERIDPCGNATHTLLIDTVSLSSERSSLVCHWYVVLEKKDEPMRNTFPSRVKIDEKGKVIHISSGTEREFKRRQKVTAGDLYTHNKKVAKESGETIKIHLMYDLETRSVPIEYGSLVNRKSMTEERYRHIVEYQVPMLFCYSLNSVVVLDKAGSHIRQREQEITTEILNLIKQRIEDLMETSDSWTRTTSRLSDCYGDVKMLNNSCFMGLGCCSAGTRHVQKILQHFNPEIVMWAHNGSRFDSVLVMNALLGDSYDKGSCPVSQIVESKGRLLTFKYLNVQFKDTCQFIAGSLIKLCSDFQIPENLKKRQTFIIPEELAKKHNLPSNTLNGQQLWGFKSPELNPSEFYDMLLEHDNSPITDQYIQYCLYDCLSLSAIWTKFHDSMMDLFPQADGVRLDGTSKNSHKNSQATTGPLREHSSRTDCFDHLTLNSFSRKSFQNTVPEADWFIPTGDLYDSFHKSIIGGRSQVMRPGTFGEIPITYLDIVSQYPATMIHFLFSLGEPIRTEKFIPNRHGIYQVSNIRWPDNRTLEEIEAKIQLRTTFPFKKPDGRLTYTQTSSFDPLEVMVQQAVSDCSPPARPRGSVVLQTVDILVAKANGCEMEIGSGVYFERQGPIFNAYMLPLIKMKMFLDAMKMTDKKCPDSSSCESIVQFLKVNNQPKFIVEMFETKWKQMAVRPRGNVALRTSVKTVLNALYGSMLMAIIVDAQTSLTGLEKTLKNRLHGMMNDQKAVLDSTIFDVLGSAKPTINNYMMTEQNSKVIATCENILKNGISRDVRERFGLNVEAPNPKFEPKEVCQIGSDLVIKYKNHDSENKMPSQLGGQVLALSRLLWNVYADLLGWENIISTETDSFWTVSDPLPKYRMTGSMTKFNDPIHRAQVLAKYDHIFKMFSFHDQLPEQWLESMGDFPAVQKMFEIGDYVGNIKNEAEDMAGPGACLINYNALGPKFYSYQVKLKNGTLLQDKGKVKTTYRCKGVPQQHLTEEFFDTIIKNKIVRVTGITQFMRTLSSSNEKLQYTILIDKNKEKNVRILSELTEWTSEVA